MYCVVYVCQAAAQARKISRLRRAQHIVYTHISDLTNSAEKEVLDGDNSVRKMVLDNLI